MTLSEKIEHNEDFDFKESDWIEVKDVKEFIKENLQDLENVRTDSDLDDFIVRFKGRAGEELVK